MPTREHAAFVTLNTCKLGDDAYLHFGSKDGLHDYTTWDVRFGYNSTDQRVVFETYRAAATSPAYAYGLVFDGDNLFTGTGAGVKQFNLYLTGGRESAVMGGDSHDMQLKIDYANEAVNTPAGSYARGLSVQMNNSSAGAITSLQGGFIGVRQRSTAAANTIRGLQIDTKVDSGKLAPDAAIEGLRVEMNVCANSPTSSYGVVVRNLTDGVYTLPTAAFKAYQDGTSSCKGFSYGLDLLSSTSVKTVDLADIRFSQTDGTLPSILATGAATTDAAIVTDIGADSLWADGSLYLSVVDSYGDLFIKRADEWRQFGVTYDPSDSRWTLPLDRFTETGGAGLTGEYARGLEINGDEFFASTGVSKSWALVLGGDREDDHVMGGDSNDMLLKLDYTNYAVNTPAGSYARGLSVQMTNRTAGVLSALQGGYIGVRQRSSGDVASLEGLQIDCKIDSGMGAPSSEISGLRVELNLCANAPDASYGVVVRNLTDGVYTIPMAAFKAYNDGTSSCPGFRYGLDLMSDLAIASGKTISLGDIRFSQKDANELPCVLFTGTGTSDGEIVTDVGADTLWADGSIYISCVDGAGTIWQKRNGTWTAF